MKQINAGTLKRLSFYLSHKIRGHDVVLYFKELGRTNLLTVSCKKCKKAVSVEFITERHYEETGWYRDS